MEIDCFNDRLRLKIIIVIEIITEPFILIYCGKKTQKGNMLNKKYYDKYNIPI